CRGNLLDNIRPARREGVAQPMKILGISAFYHDSAAALVVDGEIIAAAQEERFSRRKFDASFPLRALQYCLREASLNADKIDAVAFYDNPKLKIDRLVKTHQRFAPHGFRGFQRALRSLVGGKADQRKLLEQGLRQLDPNVDWAARVHFGEHHLSHA